MFVATIDFSCKHDGVDAEKYKGEVGLANFDTTAKPQQDFYQYVNSNWLKNNPEFKGFDTKPGDGMYRPDSARTSIW